MTNQHSKFTANGTTVRVVNTSPHIYSFYIDKPSGAIYWRTLQSKDSSLKGLREKWLDEMQAYDYYENIDLQEEYDHIIGADLGF